MKHTKSKLAKDWIAYQKINDKESHEAKKYEWAIFQFWDMVLLSPALSWEVILEVINQTDDEHILANLAAGPLESLLAEHPKVAIKWVEREMVKSPKFKNLLLGVWQNLIPGEEWEKIQKLLNNHRL